MELEPKTIQINEIKADPAAFDNQVIKILLSNKDTGGQYTLFADEFLAKQEKGTAPPHLHKWHDETFYVVSGEFEVLNGSDLNNRKVMGPGAVVFTPRGTIHSFRPLKDNSRILVFYTPGGWEHFYNAWLKLTPEQKADDAFIKEFLADFDEYKLEAK